MRPYLMTLLLVAPLPLTAQAPVDTLPLSDIDIPIRINLRLFYGMIEKNVDTVYMSPGWPGDYYEPDCTTRYQYRFRRGRLRINAQGNTFQLKFTGYYQIKASQRYCNGATPLTPWTPPCGCGAGGEAPRRVDVGFTATLALNPDYTLRSTVSVQPSHPIDQCTVCFWGQNITAQVMASLDAQLDSARMGIDSTLAHTNLRPVFQQLWQKLWTNYRLYGLGYLALQPERLRISDLYARNDTIFGSVGISARPLVSLVPRPDTVTPIPNLSDFTLRHGFNVYLDAQLNYDSLGRILSAQLAHQTFDLDNHHISVEGCSLEPLDSQHLQIGIQFSGSGSGTLYVSGTPVLDTATGTLELEDLDYHLNTNNMLMRTAGWMFNRKILKALRAYTHFNLTDYLEQLRVRANAELSGAPGAGPKVVITGIRAQGGLANIRMLGLSVNERQIEVRCQATGELQVSVDNLSW